MRSQLTVAVALIVAASSVGTLWAVEPEAVPLESTEPTLMESLTTGTPALDVRLRYKHADQEGLKASDSLTVRPRLGYGTKPYQGVQAYVELEDVEQLNNSDDSNQAGTNPGGGGRTSIADVEGAELNQAYVAAVCPLTGSDVKLGRQRIILDNARFIGNVGWRQNEQTYDAATIVWKHADLVEAAYGYIANVNRIFGEEHGTQPDGDKPNAADFESDSHLIHLSTRALPFATVTGYAYLLDLGDNSNFGATNSADTIGLRLTGKQDLREGYAITYEGEYARQTDNDATAGSLNFDADYYRVKLECATPWFGLGAGREVLGSDNGVGFSTPLATLHAFNGWADVFLATPGTGLEENFVTLGTTLAGAIDVQVACSDFTADQGGTDYGTEIDFGAKRKFGQHFTLLVQYANYMASNDAGNPRAADVEKATVEGTFAF